MYELVYAARHGVNPGEADERGPVWLGGTCPLPGALSGGGLPLLQFAFLEAGLEPLEEMSWEGPLPLLYDWTCGADFNYQVRDGRVEVLPPEAWAKPVSLLPYEGYPDVFPERRFREERNQYYFAVSTLNHLNFHGKSVPKKSGLHEFAVPMHHFGGSPFLFEPLLCQRECPACGCPMEVFGTIANDDGTTGPGYLGAPADQIVYLVCTISCQTVSAFHVSNRSG